MAEIDRIADKSSVCLFACHLGPVQIGMSTTSGQKIKQFDWAFSMFRSLGVSHLRDVRLGETPRHPSFLPKLKKEPCCSGQV